VTSAPLSSDYREHVEVFWRKYFDYVDKLLYEYNWHDHQATCWKYVTKGQEKTDRTCRMGMDGSTNPSTMIDPISKAILVKRLHPRIASYTDLITFLMKCNTNTKHIGSGDAAKAFLYYVTDYITKFSVPLHVGMAALLHTLEKTNSKYGDEGPKTKDEYSGALIIAVNSMMGKQELSHQQVMSYLIGGGDRYTSHAFQVVQWSSIFQYVEAMSNVPQQETEIVNSTTIHGSMSVTFGIREIHTNSQLLDYIYRSHDSEFDALPVYDFFARTYKVKSSYAPKSGIRRGEFCSDEHPQKNTHRLSIREHDHVPVLLGPSIPNPGASVASEESWSMMVLILFKPWRDVGDLKGSSSTWTEEYTRYRHHVNAKQGRVIKNMTSLAECKDARDFRSMHFTRKSDDEVSEAITVVHEENGLLDETEDENGINALLTMKDTSSHESLALFCKEFGNAIDISTLRHLDLCQRQGFPSKEVAGTVMQCTAELAEEVKSRASLMKLKRKRKREDGTTLHDEGVHERRSQRRRLGDDVGLVCTTTVLHHHSWLLPGNEQAARVVQSVISDMGLQDNAEQLRAFQIVADKVIYRSNEQLMMYVGGVGGTGKSHVIKAVVELFERLHRRQELILAAPTGIAAVLIGGYTLHSLVMMSPNANNRLDVEKLTEVWKGVTCLIIDEISMVDAAFLSKVSNRVRIARGGSGSAVSGPFGGIHVIFMGDFGQLKPPIEQPLYSHKIVSAPSFAQARDDSGVSALNGICIWRQVRTVVQLAKNQRQVDDTQYAMFLSRLRVGACIHASTERGDDYAYLQPRLLKNLCKNPQESMKFHDAPIIVGSKLLRDALNLRLMMRHAKSLQVDVHIYASDDIVHRQLATGALQKSLWDLSSTASKDAFGLLPLFPGMRVMITENIAFVSGIVNGREGKVRDIIYDDVPGCPRRLKVVHVHIAGCGMQVAGLDLDVVPVFPTSTSISLRKSTASKLGLKTFTRKQVPVVPAYSYTDYKAQGRTLATAIVDLASSRGQGPYVMLSRVRSLQGLAILRPFSDAKLYTRLPEELRTELRRIADLHETTTHSCR
jgi:hypothetical protein